LVPGVHRFVTAHYVLPPLPRHHERRFYLKRRHCVPEGRRVPLTRKELDQPLVPLVKLVRFAGEGNTSGVYHSEIRPHHVNQPYISLVENIHDVAHAANSLSHPNLWYSFSPSDI